MITERDKKQLKSKIRNLNDIMGYNVSDSDLLTIEEISKEQFENSTSQFESYLKSKDNRYKETSRETREQGKYRENILYKNEEYAIRLIDLSFREFYIKRIDGYYKIFMYVRLPRSYLYTFVEYLYTYPHMEIELIKQILFEWENI